MFSHYFFIVQHLYPPGVEGLFLLSHRLVVVMVLSVFFFFLLFLFQSNVWSTQLHSLTFEIQSLISINRLLNFFLLEYCIWPSIDTAKPFLFLIEWFEILLPCLSRTIQILIMLVNVQYETKQNKTKAKH